MNDKKNILIKLSTIPAVIIGLMFFIVAVATMLGYIVLASIKTIGIMGITFYCLFTLSIAFFCFYVAYKAIQRPQKKSICLLCFIYSLAIMCFFSSKIKFIYDMITQDPKYMIISLFPFIVSVLFYHLSSKALLKLVKEE